MRRSVSPLRILLNEHVHAAFVEPIVAQTDHKEVSVCHKGPSSCCHFTFGIVFNLDQVILTARQYHQGWISRGLCYMPVFTEPLPPQRQCQTRDQHN